MALHSGHPYREPNISTPLRPRVDALVIAATARELQWAASGAELAPLFPLERKWGGARLVLLVTGPGPVNTALGVGRALEHYNAGMILSVGVGGSYPNAELSPGDLAVATVEVDADWGVEPLDPGDPPGDLNFPTTTIDGVAHNRRFPVDDDVTELLFTAAMEIGHAVRGPFVTSSAVTASSGRAKRLERLYGAVCENMEGAAAAQGALIHRVPFAEVRGISNAVGPRDRSSWKIEEAADNAGDAAAFFLDSLGSDEVEGA